MNKKFTFALILLTLMVLASSCENNTTDPDTFVENPCDVHVDLNNDKICDNCLEAIEDVTVTPEISVTVVEERISLKDLEVFNFDYTSLFNILSDGVKVSVVESYLDLTQVSDAPGTFEVICNYEGQSAKVYVDVVETIYEVTLSIEEITINKTLVDEYNYLSLFSASIDGVAIEITNDMITHNIIAEEGRYEYTVTNKRVSKTLIVNVTNFNKIEVINTYSNVEIYLNELATYDFTNLFAVYVNDKAVEVTMDMIDISNLTDVLVGESYDISLTCTTDVNESTKTIKVKIIEPKELILVGKNLVIYPNAEYIDLCSLFEIKYGNEVIPVSNEMITGVINYTTVGMNEITLNYKGETAKAYVEVKKGVVISHRYSDTITVMKGTNQDSYAFTNDFMVVVNGVEMKYVNEAYLDLSTVDFNTVGTYEVKISIPYNENNVGLSGVKFTYYEEKITYVVVQNEYEITVYNDLVELEEGTTEYNVYKNIKVRINNKNQTLTEIPEYASVIACYVQTVSEPIDFNKSGNQEVVIAVYINGPQYEPVYVTFDVIIETNVLVEAYDKVVYTGDTIFTRDLFKIMNGDDIVEVTNDMIEGHVDTFTPGVYDVVISYSGIEMTAKVVVLDRNIIGTYKTLQTTIPTTEIDESDEEVTIAGKVLSNLVISEDGTIKIGAKTATITDAIDEKTFNITLRSYNYTLHYEDGILILNPDNKIKLPYNEDKRPLIYFNTELWQVLDILTINSKSEHVLTYSYPSYSIDAFKLQSTSDYSQKWYGLKVEMTSKAGSDTVYAVTWGELDFADDFIYDINKQSSVVLNDTRYAFKITAKKTAIIFDDIDTKKFVNKTFTGTYDGQAATLHVDYYGGYTFTADSKKVFYVASYNVEQMKIGGPDFLLDTVFVYDYKEVFSYKFQLDLENLTFELYDKELVFGKYVLDNYMFFFDGYGSGIFKDDMSSYYEYPFTYSMNGKEIRLEFTNPKDDFAYGKVINLYIDDFGNIITIGSCDKTNMVGSKLENQVITDGAIIRVNTTKIGKNTDTIAKQELYNSIEIITKDGVVSGDAIKNYINTKAIRFSVPGFYQFSITITVNGNTLTGYYGLQIMDSIYEGNSLVGEYSGVVDSKTKLTIDKYGVSTVTYAGTLYEGLVKIKEDGTFIITAYSNTRSSIQVTGSYMKNGLISVRGTGAATFNEHLTTGNVSVIGCEGTIIRMIQVDLEKTYVLSDNKLGFGSIVNMEVLDGNSILDKGAIVRLYNEEKERIVKINYWDNTYSGVVVSDGYRGTYTLEGQEEVFVDGFGLVKYQGVETEYDLNLNVVTFEVNSNTYVCRLNTNSYTYTNVDIALDNTLVSGKTFTSCYTYYCSDYAYTSDTTFTFMANGIVVIKSISADHDSGDDMCSVDLYAPIFASREGVNGTYTVNGNKISISINGIEFILKIKNVLDVEEIVCYSTNLDSDSHGYFGVNTIFIIE